MHFKYLQFLLVSLLTIAIESRSVPGPRFAIIFDAGSKGTRLNLFSILARDNHDGFMTYQQELDIDLQLYCELNDNGLSTYQANDSIKLKFDPCLNNATRLIPEGQRDTTLISLGATAGLRLLEVKNKNLSDTILKNIREYFNQTGYLYTNSSQARIISGSEEGMFAWIGANYLMDRFPKNKPNCAGNTFGVLDMGGSSAQVSFLAPQDPSLTNYNLDYYYENFQINNASYRTYSISYLCYGTASILNMYYANRIIESGYSKQQILTSCLPDGATVQLQGSDFLESPCTNGLMFMDNRTFTVNKNLIKPSDTFTMVGNAKKNKCRDEMSELVETSFCPFGDNKCSFNGHYMPDVQNFKFLALSNFYEAFDYTERLFKVKLQNNLPAFNQTTYDLCNLKHSALTKLNKDNNVGVSKKRLVKLCTENVYILKLFQLYGFNTLDDLKALEEIDGNKASWALGYLIYYLNNN